ncbi:hypothetical protein ACFL1R_06705 [Candidatus Latescibacterota bacterium]
MAIFLYIVVISIGLSLGALLMPLKCFVHLEGGIDKGFDITGRVMFFTGLIGGGVRYVRGIYRLNVFILSWKIVSCNITPVINYFKRKRKERPVKPGKEKKKVEEKPFLARLKSGYRKLPVYIMYVKEGLRDFRDTVKPDQFLGNVTLGLGNPALTGWISGFIIFINDLLPPKYEITPSWDFTREVLGGELSLKVTILTHILWIKAIRYIPRIKSLKKRHIKNSDSVIIQEA